MSDFEDFWLAYPRKVGKLDAMKAYGRARTLATQDELLAGVQQYLLHKPEYADWCHPATWLNKGRWMDDYTPVQQPKKQMPAEKAYVPLRFRA
jgi:hypothetical protein